MDEKETPKESPPAPTAPRIKRMNTTYVPAEDRFRITAEFDDGNVQTMWLTQRLLKLSLEPVAKYMQKTPAPSAEKKARRSYVELMNKVSGKAGPPMKRPEDTTGWMVQVMDMRFGKPAVRIVFKGEEHQALMEMDGIKLRKWLGIVHRKCIKAGWPEGMWPKDIVAQLE